MTARAIERRFGRLDSFRLLGSTGFVSDDTEQSALVAQCLLRYPNDAQACARGFRRALLGWFLRLPWGIGLATLKACLKIAAGCRRSGVDSAGNGAAMRSAILGVYFKDNPETREAFVRALSEVTHTHPLAIDGALFTASLAAACASNVNVEETDRAEWVQEISQKIHEEKMVSALLRAVNLAARKADSLAAAKEIGTSGYVLHSVPFAAFCFIRYGGDPLDALANALSAGGDTDSIGAILGGWLGALHGESALPTLLIDRIHDGPFGPGHLRALGCALANQSTHVPPYSVPAALIRNLALFPVILLHGFRRLIP